MPRSWTDTECRTQFDHKGGSKKIKKRLDSDASILPINTIA